MTKPLPPEADKPGTDAGDPQRSPVASPGQSPPADSMEGEVSLLEVVNVLLKRWKLLAGLPLLIGFLAAGVSLILPEYYRATTTFVPETETDGTALPAGLIGLASRFGVTGPGGRDTPEFYARILASRTLRETLLQTLFPDPTTAQPGDSSALLDILAIDGGTDAERVEAGQEVLSELTSVEIDDATSIVSVSVETRFPTLSAALADHYVELLNRFNLENRRSGVQQRRRFVEDRVADLGDELQRAEDDLRIFLEQNRQFEGSPQLRFRYERMQRQVAIKQEVFTALRRQYEDARIQEVNDAPVITIIDRAVRPTEKSRPRRRQIVMLAFALATGLAVVAALGAEFIERARARDQADFRELTSRWSQIVRPLRSPRRF